MIGRDEMTGGSDEAGGGGRLLLISKVANGTSRRACVELDAVGARDDSEILGSGGTGLSCSLFALTRGRSPLPVLFGVGVVTGGSGLV